MKWIQAHICINEQRWEGPQLGAFIPCFFTCFKTNFPLLLQLPLICVISYSVQTLCDPLDCRLLCPWDFPGKNTGVACHFLIQPASPLSPALVGGFFTTEPPGKKAPAPLLLLLNFWSEQNKPSERSLICTSELSLVESYKVGAIINPLNRLGMEGKMATHSKILAPGKSHGRGAQWATGHGVPKRQTWLSDWGHTRRLKNRLQKYFSAEQQSYNTAVQLGKK